jgi:hypothetical protein
MSEDLAPAAITNARDAAHKARRLSDEHQRANRDTDPGDAEVSRRGDELKRLAADASAKYEVAKQQARGAASVKRRQEGIAHDAQLQARLRAEAQARREAAAASEPPPPRRGHR